MVKKNLYLLARICISVFLIFLLLFRTNWASVYQIFATASLGYVAAFFLISLVLTTVSCWKWQILLEAQEINVPLLRLVLVYHVGYFFNNFMPSNVGGDLVRSHEIARFTNKSSESFVSVFMERFTGFTALLLFAILVLAARVEWIGHPFILPVLLVATAGYLISVMLIYYRTLPQRLKSYMTRLRMGKIEKKLGEIYKAIVAFKDKKVALLWALSISLAFYVLTVVNVYLASKALNIQVGIFNLALVVPIVLLVAAVPVSLNGMGVSEVAYIYYLSLIGISEPHALSIALMMRAKAVLVSVIGGLIFVLLNRASRNPHTGRDAS